MDWVKESKGWISRFFSLPNRISRCLEGEDISCQNNHPCRSSLKLQCKDSCPAGTIWKMGGQEGYKNKKPIQNPHRIIIFFLTNILTFQDGHTKRVLNCGICFCFWMLIFQLAVSELAGFIKNVQCLWLVSLK